MLGLRMPYPPPPSEAAVGVTALRGRLECPPRMFVPR